MKKKVSIFLLAVIFILTTLIIPTNQNSNQVHAAGTMKVGDYVLFGKYLGKPILWRVINIENGSPLLFSEKIISIKAYDAAESGKYYRTGSNPYTTDEARQKYGSNQWENSNIREWLNSSDAKVKYTTQPPTKAAVSLNAYDAEPGFLSNFTEGERNAIKPVTHKAILADIDKGKKTGGSEKHIYNENMITSLENYDVSYYKNVTDKVYLLDIKELYDYVYKRGYEYIKKPTKEAVEQSEYKYKILDPNNYWYYWLRLPCALQSSYVRHVDSDNFVYSSNANYYSGGIVPALNLKSGTYKSGKGTIDDPYIPDEGKIDNTLYAKAYAAVQNAKSTKTQKSINAARASIEALKGTSAHWAIGIFSAQVDTVQQPILAKVNSAVTKAKNTMKQAEIDAIRTAMDPDLPDKLKNNYLVTIQELQESLVGKAIEAHNKAVQSGSYADKSVAQALFADLEKAVDPAVAAWAKNAKNQTGIMQQVVTIKDKNLEKAIRNALNKPTGDLYKSELQSMTSLNGTGMSITDLSSLKYLTNLTDLRLDNNKISDISILKELKNLKYLSLSNNNISDITPLQGLTNLNKLFLNFNKITDISAVKNLTNLTWFYVEGNQIKNISVLHGLTKLTNLNLYNNEIRNLDIIALKKALPKCSFYNQ